MYRYIIVLLLISVVAKCGYADNGWQSYLENNSTFDYIFAFEDFDDWQPTSPNTGDNFSPSVQPTAGGNPTRLVGFQYWVTSAPSEPWIGNHGGEYTLGDKSLQMTFANGTGGDTVGPSMALFYIGNGNEPYGTRNDGFETLHVFYAMKFRRTEINIRTGLYTWEPTGTNNEYYLQHNSGDPSLDMPNTLIIDGVYTADPVVIGGSSPAGQYSTRDDNIGSLSAGDWCYGDPASLGYETIIVRLSDDEDPDTKADGYIKYQTGNLVQTSDTTIEWIGVWKHQFAAQGFWYDRSTYPYLHYYDGTFSDGCTEPTETVYGNNFTILNWLRISGHLTIGTEDGLASVGSYGGTCYGYIPSNTGVSTFARDTAGLISQYENNEWIYVETVYNKGTCGSYDGSITLTYYNANGTTLGTETHSGLLMCNDPNPGVADMDNPYNQFHFGGNRLGTGYAYDSSDSWENRYYIDDVIFDNESIAPTYFSLASSYSPSSVTNTISTINNQTVSDSSFTVQGTASTTNTSITGVTMTGGVTCTADDGSFNSNSEAYSCSTTLSEGLQTLTTTATDDQTETGMDSVVITVTLTPSETITTAGNMVIQGVSFQ